MTTTATTPNAATVLQILKLLRAGSTVSTVALATGVAPDVVEETARANGWPDSSSTLDAAIRGLEKRVAAAVARPTSRARPDRSNPLPPSEPTIEELIVDAKATGLKALRTRAARAEREIDALRDAYEAYRARQERREEVTRLERQLAKARAAAGIPDQGADKLVRAWAKRQGMEVGDRGRLSQRIRDAYVAAHSRKDAR